jgi:hypothetical protein
VRTEQRLSSTPNPHFETPHDLSWSGPSGTSFHVYRNGTRIATVEATAYTDNINRKGAGTSVHRVCAVSIPVCSNETTVTF